MTNQFRYFLKSNFVENRCEKTTRFNAQKYYLPEIIIKNNNVIINLKTSVIRQSTPI